MNDLILAEYEQAMAQVPDWWTAGPTDQEIEEMARHYEEREWGRLVIENDALDKKVWL